MMSGTTPGLVRVGVAAAAGAVLAWTLFFSPASFRGHDLIGNVSPFADGYVESGESLLHGVASESFLVPNRMPLAAAAGAWMFGHSGPRGRGLWHSLPAVLCSVLVFAFGTILLSPLCGAAGFFILHVLVLHRAAGWLWDFPQAHYSVLVLTTACLLVRSGQPISPQRALLLAASIGVGFLYRSSLVLFPPVFVLYELIAARREGRPSAWGPVLTVLVVPYLFVLPVALMNWKLGGGFVPFERHGPDLNIISGALGVVEVTAGDWASFLGEGLGTAVAHGVYSWAAWEIFAHPFRYGVAVASRIWFVLSMQPALFVLGAFSIWKHRRSAGFQKLGLLSAYFVGVHCLMAVRGHFMTPLWPLLSVLSAAAFLRPAQAGRRDQKRADRLAVRAVFGVFGASLFLALVSLLTFVRFTMRADRGPEGDAAALELELKNSPTDAWLWHTRGRRRQRNGKTAEAAEDYSRASQLRPEDVRLRLESAWASMLAGDPRVLDAIRIPAGHGDRIELMLGAKIAGFVASERKGERGKADELLDSAWKLWKAESLGSRYGTETGIDKGILDRAVPLTPTRFARDMAILWSPLVSPRDRLALANGLSRLELGDDLLEERLGLLFENGDGKRALSLLEAADAEGKVSDEQLDRLYRLCRRLGRPEWVIALLELRIRRLPDDQGLWSERASLSARVGDPAKVLESLSRLWRLRRASGRGPGEGTVDLAETAALELGGRRPELDFFEAALDAFPEDPSLLAAHARLASRAGRRNSETLLLLARDQVRLGEHRSSMETFGKAIRALPKDAALRVAYAQQAIQAGERELALASLKEAAGLGSEPALMRSLADAFAKLGEHGAALESFEKAIGPGRPVGGAGDLLELAQYAIAAGRREKALKALDAARGLKPDLPESRRLAVLYGEIGESERMKETFDALARRFPDDPGLMVDQASAAEALGEPRRAEDLLRRAIAADPSIPILRRVALLYQEWNDYPRANEIWRRLARSEDLGVLPKAEAAEILRDKGVGEFLGGSPEAAVSDLEAALRLEPGLLSAYASLAAIHVRQGRFKEALKLYDRALSVEPAKKESGIRAVLRAGREELLGKIESKRE